MTEGGVAVGLNRAIKQERRAGRVCPRRPSWRPSGKFVNHHRTFVPRAERREMAAIMGHHQTNTKNDVPSCTLREAPMASFSASSALSGTSALILPCVRQAKSIPTDPRVAPNGVLPCGWLCRSNTESAEDAERTEKAVMGASRNSEATRSSKLM